MKVTTITVTFNSARTIVETLKSVARQTHRDIEHIVIDGGSTDGTLDLIAKHGAHVATVISEPDKGIYDAMNKGLQLANGTLVGFLNSDDTYASDDVVEIIARAALDRKVDAIYGDLMYVDPARRQPIVRYWRAGDFSPTKLRFGWMPPHPTLYVRRDVVKGLGAFDSNLKIAADYDFILKLFGGKGLRVAYIPQVLVKMRIGGASNKSLSALVQKSQEDLLVLRKYNVGGLISLVAKNLRKLPQFLSKPK